MSIFKRVANIVAMSLGRKTVLYPASVFLSWSRPSPKPGEKGELLRLTLMTEFRFLWFNFVIRHAISDDFADALVQEITEHGTTREFVARHNVELSEAESL